MNMQLKMNSVLGGCNKCYTRDYMEEHHSPKHTILLSVNVSLLFISYILAMWYITYQGTGDGFPRNETPEMYHLVGIAIVLTILTSLSIGFAIFCIIKLKRYLKLIPTFSILAYLIPLLFFMYEIYRWS